MPENSYLMRIFFSRLARGGVGAIPIVGPVLVEAVFGTLDEVAEEKWRTEILRALEEGQQRGGDSASPMKLLENLKTHDSLKSIDHVILNKVLDNLIACLEDPSTPPLDELKPAIEKHVNSQEISEGTLIGVDKSSVQGGTLVEIGNIEIGKLFFPLHFIRKSFQSYFTELDSIQAPPFDSLFMPPDIRGYKKFICVVFENNQLVLTAYPKPIQLNSPHRGRDSQLDEIVVNWSKPVSEFEYWPRGGREEKSKFIVSVHFGNPAEIRFREKDSTESSVLSFKLSFALSKP